MSLRRSWIAVPEHEVRNALSALCLRSRVLRLQTHVLSRRGRRLLMDNEETFAKVCRVVRQAELLTRGRPLLRLVHGGGQGMTPTGHRILVIEDDDDNRLALVTLLGLWGHRVESAEDGISGLDLALRLRPDAVILDGSVPGLNGLAVARAIHAAMGPRRPLIVFYTGYVRETDYAAATAAGVDVFLSKPSGLDELERLFASPELTSHRRRTGT